MSVAIDYETASACPLCKYLKTVYVWIPDGEWENLHLVNYSPSVLTLTSSVRAAVKEFLGLVKEGDVATQTAIREWGITPTLMERHRPVKVTLVQKVAWRNLRAGSIGQHVAKDLAGRAGQEPYFWGRFTRLIRDNLAITADSYVQSELKRRIKTRMQKLNLKGKEIAELSISLAVAHLKELYNERTRPQRAGVARGVEEAVG